MAWLMSTCLYSHEKEALPVASANSTAVLLIIRTLNRDPEPSQILHACSRNFQHAIPGPQVLETHLLP